METIPESALYEFVGRQAFDLFLARRRAATASAQLQEAMAHAAGLQQQLDAANQADDAVQQFAEQAED